MGGRRLTVSLAVVLAVLVVVGAGAAFGVGRAQRLAGQATTEGTTTAPPSSPGEPAAGTAGGQSAPSQPTEQQPEQSSDQGKPTSQVQATRQPSSSERQPPTVSVEEPGLPVISMSPRALSSVRSQEVADLLQRFFGAINRHDYDAWLTTVSRSQATRDRDEWSKSYSTTRDTDIYVSDIRDGNPLIVRMQFRSHQAVELAPTALPLPCVRWDVTYQLVDEGIGLRVGNSAEKPSMSPCT